MKKLNLFFTLLLTITLFSCGSDDSTSPRSEETSGLLGIWELSAKKQNGVNSMLDICEQTSNFEFKSDQSYAEETFVLISDQCVSDGAFAGTWSVSGDILTLTFTENEQVTINTPKYSITGDQLTLTFPEVEETYTKQ